MPVLRIPGILATALFGLFLSAVHLGAQEEEKSDPKVAGPLLPRFFDRPIDFWQRGLPWDGEKIATSPITARLLPSKSSQKAAPSEWGQMVKQPDGSLVYQDLPRPLVQVLEDPSPEKIRAYFEWKLSRTQKILRAAQAMKEYRPLLGESAEAGIPVPPPSAGAKSGPAVNPPGKAEGPEAPKAVSHDPFTVTYFHRSGCPHCDTQDLILARWLKERPEGKLVTLDFGEKPELWQKYHVRGTPSLVIESQGSRAGVFLEGVSRKNELEKALLESDRLIPAKKAPEGGEQ